MPELRDLLTGAGFKDVRTYVQSGNVVLTSGASPSKLTRQVEEEIERVFGFPVKVVVRKRTELAEVVGRNPLAKVAVDPKRYQVSFLSAKPKAEVVRKLTSLAAPAERFVAIGREFYAWHPDGIG